MNAKPEMIALNIAVNLFVLLTMGVGLWKSARNNEKQWFIGIFLAGIFYGILPLLYLFVFAKHKMKLSELAFWKKQEEKK